MSSASRRFGPKYTPDADIVCIVARIAVVVMSQDTVGVNAFLSRNDNAKRGTL